MVIKLGNLPALEGRSCSMFGFEWIAILALAPLVIALPIGRDRMCWPKS